MKTKQEKNNKGDTIAEVEVTKWKLWELLDGGEGGVRRMNKLKSDRKSAADVDHSSTYPTHSSSRISISDSTQFSDFAIHQMGHQIS